MERPAGGASAKKKLVVVMGSTGVGKSQLAIDLALAHQQKEGQRAEIINADSMQVYRGFPVATAKVTEEEKAGVVHHLLDVVAPTDTSFNVIQYCRLALATIADIHRRGNLPIVVGGTHYYLEALLWENVLLHDINAPLVPKPLPQQDQQSPNTGQEEDEQKEEIEEIEEEKKEVAEQDYKRLTEVDPLTASWLHPHNARKVKRALEVYYTTGKPYSQMLCQQAPPIPRFDALLFWVDCDRAVLNARLDKRVDKMIQAGLLEEVAELRRAFESEGLPMDYTKGILQAIGYKEFAPYFASAPNAEVALTTCVAALKQRTRRYAKVQTSWILRHFRPRATIYRVDSTEAEQPKKWNDQVRLPASHVLNRWHEGLSTVGGNGDGDEGFAMMRFVEVLRPSSSLRAMTTKRATSERTDADEEGGGGDCGSEKKRNKKEDEGRSCDREGELEVRWRRFVCEDCNGKILQGEGQYQAHLKSRGHHHHRKRLRQQQFMAATAVVTPNE